MLKSFFDQICRSFTTSSPGKANSNFRASLRSRSNLAFESLEARNLLATLSLDAGVLTIGGDDLPDSVVLFQNLDGTFDVEEFGSFVATYNNVDVNEIVFRGRGGDDEFVNNTFVPSSFFGHSGDDVFFGGTSNDRAIGGDGDDELYGGIGEDYLAGGDGNDLIYGEQDDDTVFGGLGDDEIYGGDGDDFLSAEEGNDLIYGGAGDDFLRGFKGDDTIAGDAGDDLVYGQAGDDYITGGDGNDRLRGNNDHDTIFGNGGNDVLIGDVGDDTFYGGDGDDISYGFTGDDVHNGGDGNDQMFDSAGDDELNGGDGNDILRSGSGNDVLRGGDGSDTLRSEDGRDLLYGGGGLDRLFAGYGDDSLHGGAGSEVDLIQGEQGADRFHEDDGDAFVDRAAEDVTIEYLTEFVQWFDEEIELLDEGFQELYFFTGSQLLLQETHDGNANVTVIKVQDLPGSTTSENTINPLTNQREIRIIDFDETTVIGQEFFRDDIVRQIGYNWNSASELDSALPNAQSQWDSFLQFSSWTDVNPQSSSFELSEDGQWWFHQSADFYNLDGAINPGEDFAGIWTAIFEGSVQSDLLPKANFITSLLRSG